MRRIIFAIVDPGRDVWRLREHAAVHRARSGPSGVDGGARSPETCSDGNAQARIRPVDARQLAEEGNRVSTAARPGVATSGRPPWSWRRAWVVSPRGGQRQHRTGYPVLFLALFGGAVVMGSVAWRVSLVWARRPARMRPACAATPAPALARRSRRRETPASTRGSRPCCKPSSPRTQRSGSRSSTTPASPQSTSDSESRELISSRRGCSPIPSSTGTSSSSRARRRSSSNSPNLSSTSSSFRCERGSPARISARGRREVTRFLVKVAFDVRRAFVTVRSAQQTDRASATEPQGGRSVARPDATPVRRGEREGRRPHSRGGRGR